MEICNTNFCISDFLMILIIVMCQKSVDINCDSCPFMCLFMIIQGPQKVKYGKAGLPDTTITAKNIIIATGSVPFVPKGVEVDGKSS